MGCHLRVRQELRPRDLSLLPSLVVHQMCMPQDTDVRVALSCQQAVFRIRKYIAKCCGREANVVNRVTILGRESRKSTWSQFEDAISDVYEWFVAIQCIGGTAKVDEGFLDDWVREPVQLVNEARPCINLLSSPPIEYLDPVKQGDWDSLLEGGDDVRMSNRHKEFGVAAPRVFASVVLRSLNEVKLKRVIVIAEAVNFPCISSGDLLFDYLGLKSGVAQ